jgi:adenosylcobinamide-GDP ribazoletransferase
VRAALGFLTPLPSGGGVPDRRTLAWFPFVGALVGLVVGGVWWGGGEWWPPLAAAGLAVAADALLTGALHLDGLADSADGLLPHLDGPDRRRAVMAAPDVGAFGLVAVLVVLVLRWSALASMAPDALLVAALWCGSRTAMAIALRRGPYVGGGLGSAFSGAAAWPLAIGVVSAAALAVVAGEPGAVAGVLAGAAGVVAIGHRRLGGVTGDVLGAAGVVGETVGLLVASATW